VLDAQTLTQSAGTTTVSSDGILQLAGTFDLRGGFLTGNSGYIVGNVVNGETGAVQPGGAGGIGFLVIFGDYTQSGDGRLELELAATDRFDFLQVTGLARLGGTLQVSLLDGFDPAVGDAFQVFVFEANQGTFNTINLPNLGGGRFFDPVFDPTSLTLIVRQS